MRAFFSKRIDLQELFKRVSELEKISESNYEAIEAAADSCVDLWMWLLERTFHVRESGELTMVVKDRGQESFCYVWDKIEKAWQPALQEKLGSERTKA